MGAWVTKNFENDHAYDWLNSFLKNPVRAELEELFDFVLDQREYLSNHVSEAALVAAELVAARLGRASNDFPVEVDISADLTFSADAALVEMAARVVNRVHYFPGHADSRELWQEAGAADYAEWEAVLSDLLTRLQHV